MTEVSILCQKQCELGEGPFYCERRNTLFWFDIVTKLCYAYDFSTGAKRRQSLQEQVSAMAVVDDENDVVFTASGLYLQSVETQKLSQVIEIEADNPITRSNDARVHPAGAFWLGTMGKNAEAEAGSIYHYRSGTLTKLYDKITIPNAICFSPDAKTAYFTDTVTAKLMRVTTDPDTGLPTAEPEVFVDHTENEGGLDGAIVDAHGNIWVALWGASCLNCYSPDGQLLKTISVPVSQPSCPAFVGDGQIAVTSAWQGMDEAAKASDPNAGKTFLLNTNARPKYEPRVLI